MPDRPEPPRMYDEQAVSSILKRAAELQASSRDERGFGLSLDELQQVAAEAGIDPAYVALAATEFIHPPEPETNWWGGPLTYTFEWAMNGEIDEVAWEEIVAETRRHFKDTGEVRVWSNSREWAHSGRDNVQAHVTATSRDGLTRFRLFWSEPTMAVAAYIPLLVLSLLMLPITFEALALTGLTAAAFYFGVVAILFTAARWFMSHLSRGKKVDLFELKTRLEQIAGDSMRTELRATTASETAPMEPLLDDEYDAQESEQRTAGRTRERS